MMKIRFFYLSVTFAISAVSAQQLKYDSDILIVEEFNSELYNFKLNEPSDFQGVIDFNQVRLFQKKESYKQGELFVYDCFTVCNHNAFLFSDNLLNDSTIDSSFGQGWLVVQAERSYKILVHQTLYGGLVDYISILDNNRLLIMESIDENYDLTYVSKSISGKFIALEFQNNGNYMLLTEEEARGIGKEYKFF